MGGENFVTKDYLKSMKVEDARIKFKIRTEMLDVKFNYKNVPGHRAKLWLCDSCETSIDSQSHILWCPSYAELREGKDIRSDKDLINYVKSVMKIRDKLKIDK